MIKSFIDKEDQEAGGRKQMNPSFAVTTLGANPVYKSTTPHCTLPFLSTFSLPPPSSPGEPSQGLCHGEHFPDLKAAPTSVILVTGDARTSTAQHLL